MAKVHAKLDQYLNMSTRLDIHLYLLQCNDVL